MPCHGRGHAPPSVDTARLSACATRIHSFYPDFEAPVGTLPASCQIRPPYCPIIPTIAVVNPLTKSLPRFRRFDMVM